MIEALFHGHSFVELILPEGSILIDPFITNNPKCDISLEDVNKKNLIAILITHGHSDHIGDTVAIKQAHLETPIYTVSGVADYLSDQGLSNLHGGSIGGTMKHELFQVKLYQAVHDGSIADSEQCTNPSGMLITINNKVIYHSGDTALTKDLELLEDMHIDLCFLPIGGYYTMDAKDAVIAAKMIKAKTVVPIHYNTRPIIKADALQFASDIMNNRCSIPKVLNPGQSFILL